MKSKTMITKTADEIGPTQGWLEKAANHVVILGRLLFHPAVPWYAKLIMWAAIIYWISPVDFIMGIPGLDAVDDIAVLYFADRVFFQLCPKEVVKEVKSR